MEMIVQVMMEVKIPTDRCNVNELFDAVSKARDAYAEKLALMVVEAYEKQVVQTLCRPSGLAAKKGLGLHEEKTSPGRRCRCRRFKRAGHWSDLRAFDSDVGSISFRPALVACRRCGKRITPILGALELEDYQSRTDPLFRKTMEAIAETSYRRGSAQLEVLTHVPVAKSTLHRWAASVELPVSEGTDQPFLLADGTGFKRQPGQRGEVRMVLEMAENGTFRPLGVWAGTDWQEIRKQLKARLKGQPELLMSDGERGIERWLSGLTRGTTRCHWHFPRGSSYLLWKEKVPLAERKDVLRTVRQLLAIEIPQEDVEMVSREDKEALRERIASSEAELYRLHQDFAQKGYAQAADYFDRARHRLFSHLRLWLQTGIVAPRTTSLIENIIRELVRRLKKVGWNWSDAGATRMGRMVMIRRYDSESWRSYWQARMNLQGRCEIKLLNWEIRHAA